MFCDRAGQCRSAKRHTKDDHDDVVKTKRKKFFLISELGKNGFYLLQVSAPLVTGYNDIIAIERPCLIQDALRDEPPGH